jgi:hypothetical protein
LHLRQLNRLRHQLHYSGNQVFSRVWPVYPVIRLDLELGVETLGLLLSGVEAVICLSDLVGLMMVPSAQVRPRKAKTTLRRMLEQYRT